MTEQAAPIEINMLPAKNGDCIHIRFQSRGTWYNIIIDSGPGTCSGQFGALLDRIREHGEAVDLLCFTHIDDDHIRAAEKVLSRRTFDASCIKMVWLNLPPSAASNSPSQAQLNHCRTSVSTACELWLVIAAKGIPCKTRIIAGMQMVLGEAVIDVLLPTQDRMDAYYEKWEREAQALRRKGKYILTSVGNSDSSQTNGSSITLMLTVNGKKLLFTGDAFAEDLTEAAQNHAADEGFFLVKLPHHGSDANISSQMLEHMKCTRFLISTDQRPDRPSQAAIDLLADYGSCHGGAILYGNYPWHSSITPPEKGLQIIQLPGKRSPIKSEELTLYSEG